MDNRHEQKSKLGLFAWAALILSFGTLVLCWSVASPPGSSPDEIFHIGSSWCAFGESDSCLILERRDLGYTWAEIPFSADLCFKEGVDSSALCISRSHPETQLAPFNGFGLYPPSFFIAGNFFLRLFGVNGVLIFRIFNGVLFSLLLFAAYLLTNRGVRLGLVSAGLIFLVPQGVFLVTSFNPSGWSFIGVTTSWAFLSAFFWHARSGNRLRASQSLIFWGLSIVLSSARYDSIIYAALVNSAVLVPNLKWLWKSARFSIALVASVATLGIVYSHQLVLGGLQALSNLTQAPGALSFARYWLIHFLEIPLTSMGLNYGSYGPTGSLDVLTPPIVGHIQFGFLAVVLLLSLKNRYLLQRTYFAIFLAILFLIILQQVSISHETGFYFVQGRYFLPFIAGAIGLIVSMSTEDNFLLSYPSLTNSSFFLLVTSHSLALFSFIRRYSSGTMNDYKSFQIDNDLNFSLPDGWRFLSALGPQTILVLGTIAFATIAWIVLHQCCKTEPSNSQKVAGL